MKAILIDPVEKTVTEIADDFHKLDRIYKALDCTTFDCLDVGMGQTLYLDDEGLLRDEPGPFFQLAGYDQPLAGRGLILGVTADGDTTDTSLTAEQVAAKVTFPNVRFLRKPENA